MKNFIVTIIGLMISIPVFSQHLLVLKNNNRKVVNVQQENGTSVYYSDWPDTTKKDIKAALQDDIFSLTPIQASDVDSIVAVVSAKNDLRDAKVNRLHKKYGSYYAQKVSIGYNSEISQIGMAVECGLEVIDKYRMGIGFGVDKIVVDSAHAIQTPFYLSCNPIILKMKNENRVYGIVNVGYSFVLNEDEKLGDNRLMTLGMGMWFQNFFIIELYFKSQRAQTIYQENGRANIVGFNFGFLL